MGDVSFYTNFFEHTLNEKKDQWCIQLWFSHKKPLTIRFPTEEFQKKYLGQLKIWTNK